MDILPRIDRQVWVVCLIQDYILLFELSQSDSPTISHDDNDTMLSNIIFNFSKPFNAYFLWPQKKSEKDRLGKVLITLIIISFNKDIRRAEVCQVLGGLTRYERSGWLLLAKKASGQALGGLLDFFQYEVSSFIATIRKWMIFHYILWPT